MECQECEVDASPSRTGGSSLTSGDLGDISSFSSKASGLQRSSSGGSSGLSVGRRAGLFRVGAGRGAESGGSALPGLKKLRCAWASWVGGEERRGEEGGRGPGSGRVGGQHLSHSLKPSLENLQGGHWMFIGYILAGLSQGRLHCIHLKFRYVDFFFLYFCLNMYFLLFMNEK